MTPKHFFYRDNLSENTKAYYDDWKVILHRNCNNMSLGCTCEESTRDLVLARLQYIKNGKPDLHPKIEAEVWSHAFVLHHKRHSTISGIYPSWAMSVSYAQKCTCFEDAMKELNINPENKPEVVKLILVDPEDAWYENRFD